MYGKRLYEMGGDITSDFYSSNSANGSMWPGGKKKKKVIFGTGRPLKKGQHRGCRGGICT